MGLFAGLAAADGTQARLRVLEAAAARASEESGLHSGLLSSMRSAVSEAARLAGRGMPPIPNYGSAALLPTPRRVGTAPPDADTWPAKAQHLAELCKHDVTSLSDEKAEELSALVAFLADVANAQPHEEWATGTSISTRRYETPVRNAPILRLIAGEVLTEMAKSTAEHIFRILIVRNLCILFVKSPKSCLNCRSAKRHLCYWRPAGCFGIFRGLTTINQ